MRTGWCTANCYPSDPANTLPFDNQVIALLGNDPNAVQPLVLGETFFQRSWAAVRCKRPAYIIGTDQLTHAPPSVDQLVSSVPGFIAQEKANVRYKLTRQRFKAGTVFVDHFSCLSYVHVHTSTGGDEAVQAKEAFKAYAAQHGVYVKHALSWIIVVIRYFVGRGHDEGLQHSCLKCKW